MNTETTTPATTKCDLSLNFFPRNTEGSAKIDDSDEQRQFRPDYCAILKAAQFTDKDIEANQPCW